MCYFNLTIVAIEPWKKLTTGYTNDQAQGDLRTSTEHLLASYTPRFSHRMTLTPWDAGERRNVWTLPTLQPALW